MLMRSALVFVHGVWSGATVSFRMRTLRFPSTDWWRHGLAQRPPAVKLLWTLKATVWLMRLPLCRSHPGLRTESHTKVWNCKVRVTQLCFSFLVFFPLFGASCRSMWIWRLAFPFLQDSLWNCDKRLIWIWRSLWVVLRSKYWVFQISTCDVSGLL